MFFCCHHVIFVGLSRLIYIDKILIDMNKTVIRTTKTFVIFLVFVSLYGALIAFANQLSALMAMHPPTQALY